ncbi:MAG: hypothetical protein RL701_4239 [Pseudomonadota bacterium]
MKQQQETVLDVTGMTCASCVRHVDHALGQLEGVAGVNIDLSAGEVRVRHDAAMAPVGSLIAALGEAGYGAAQRGVASQRVRSGCNCA